MVKKIILLLIYLSNSSIWAQKQSFFSLRASGIFNLPDASFQNINNFNLNGKTTPAIALYFTRSLNEGPFSIKTGLNFNLRKFKVEKNYDTVFVAGSIELKGKLYTIPTYTIVSLPFLLQYNKKILIKKTAISKKSKDFNFAFGICMDFNKEANIKDGISFLLKGASYRAAFNNNFNFKSKIGAALLTEIHYPIFNFRTNRTLALFSSYKYSLYYQNDLELNYKITTNSVNENNIKLNINKIKINELHIGLNYSF